LAADGQEFAPMFLDLVGQILLPLGINSLPWHFLAQLVEVIIDSTQERRHSSAKEAFSWVNGGDLASDHSLIVAERF
jgi:chemotaxis regulatin CheY-phosphate phosphatase CheZ